MRQGLTPEQQSIALQRMLNAARNATAEGKDIRETVDAVAGGDGAAASWQEASAMGRHRTY